MSTMPQTRREFLGTVSAAAALSGIPRPSGYRSDDDPLGVRADFPVVQESIYLDAPYITPSPRQAVEAATAFAEAKGRDPVSLGRMLQETDTVRSKFAQLVGASESEIGMLFATSEGENIVARALELGAGDNVVIDDLHYDTTYVLYRHLEETRGLEVRIVESEDGRASVDAFAEQVDSRTRMVSVSWISHQNGYNHDLKGLAELAHAHDAYLYADAIQGVGMIDLDVRATGIDFFTSGTYKWLLGGFGVAPFFVREEVMDAVTVDRLGALHVAEELGDHRYKLHEDGRKFDYATLAFGAVFQLSAGLDYLLKVGVPNIEGHTVALAHRLWDGLAAQGYPILTPERNHSSIVTFEPGTEVERIRSAFEAEKIRVSFKEGGRQIRTGAALFNNVDDIDALLAVTGRGR
jgi:selenocysteine lyase/cysteine desulfurase